MGGPPGGSGPPPPPPPPRLAASPKGQGTATTKLLHRSCQAVGIMHLMMAAMLAAITGSARASLLSSLLQRYGLMGGSAFRPSSACVSASASAGVPRNWNEDHQRRGAQEARCCHLVSRWLAGCAGRRHAAGAGLTAIQPGLGVQAERGGLGGRAIRLPALLSGILWRLCARQGSLMS